jgi:hypothetical protein
MIKIQICLLPMMYFRRMLVIRIWATIKMFLLERYVFIVNSKMYLFFHPHNSNKPVVYCCYFEMQSQHVAEVLLKESCATAVLLSNFRIKISSHLTSTTYIWPDLSFLLTLPRSFCPSNTQQTKQSKITAADEYNKQWVEFFLDLLLWLVYAVNLIWTWVNNVWTEVTSTKTHINHFIEKYVLNVRTLKTTFWNIIFTWTSKKPNLPKPLITPQTLDVGFL